jgi:RHS repeat-associated protein
LSLGNSFDLKWDAWNRLIEVKNTGGSVVATYGYDGAHRRVTKVAGGNTRHYYYSDQWQVLEERLDSASTADKRFVWGVRAVDDLVLRNHGSTRHYALSDAMGSVTAIVNTSGTVQERYGYDGFGQPRYMNASFGSRSSSSYTWETLFDGYRYDPESGLYQVRYRYLHPRLGRWVSRDPIQEHKGVNLYAFVKNGPLSFLDPSGLARVPCNAKALLGCITRCVTFAGEHFVEVKYQMERNWWVLGLCWRVYCRCVTQCYLIDGIPMGAKIICLYNCPVRNPRGDPANYIPIVVPASEGCPPTIRDDT